MKLENCQHYHWPLGLGVENSKFTGKDDTRKEPKNWEENEQTVASQTQTRGMNTVHSVRCYFKVRIDCPLNLVSVGDRSQIIIC